MEGEQVSRIDHIEMSADPIDVLSVHARVAHPGAGATVVFVGTVRDHSADHPGVTHLDYEAYLEEVESVVRGVVTGLRERWSVLGVALVHRVGRLQVGEPSVVAAVSAAHREEAFAAGRYLIDETKRTAPIWKKEHWEGGAEWVREDREHDGA